MSGETLQREPAGEGWGEFPGLVIATPPLLVGVPEASRLLGMSPASVKRMVSSGALPSVLAGPGGGRRLLATADLAAYVAGLERQHGIAAGEAPAPCTAPTPASGRSPGNSPTAGRGGGR